MFYNTNLPPNLRILKDEIEGYAREAGREVGVLTTTHVVCRETEAEAHQYYRFYAEENADADGRIPLGLKDKNFARRLVIVVNGKVTQLQISDR